MAESVGRAYFFIELLLLLALTQLSVLELTAQPSSAEREKLPFAVPTQVSALDEYAEIETTKGSFEIRFFREDAPITVASFQYLAARQFFNNLTFHKKRQGFVIEGGDPKGNGLGGPGYTLPPEISPIKHLRGTLGMARRQNEINPDRRSNGSVFYITYADLPKLDGLYTVFARVISGMEVVERLEVGDRILEVRLLRNQ